MANTFYAKQNKATTAAFMGDFARFLINDLAGFTGPGWTIVDTYSGAAATKHEVPGTPSNMDSLAADNGWRTNTIAVNDYIILANNNASYPFQLGIEFQSTTLIRFILAPKGGFVTANNDADMTAAGNWGSAKLTTFDYTTVNSPANYSIVADEDRFMLYFDLWPTVYWTYIGNPDTTELFTGDSYPAMLYNAENSVHFTNGLDQAYWRRLSAVDDSTEITLSGATASSVTSYSKDAATNEYRLFPIYAWCSTAGQLTMTSKLKGLYNTSAALGTTAKGTLNSMDYAFVSSAAYNAIVWDWDGVTSL